MSKLSSDVLERIELLRKLDDERVAARGRSFALLHDAKTPRSAVLFHGLTASPAQFTDLAGALHQRGYNVFVPRIPHHGHANRMTEALANLTVRELKDATSEAVAIASELGEELTIVGFSLGGLLAAWSAHTFPAERAVAIAPFLGVRFAPNHWAKTIAARILQIPNAFVWWDLLKRERHGDADGYPRYASHAVANMYALVAELMELAAANVPLARELTIVSNAHETTVSNRMARELLSRWSAHGARAGLRVLDDLPMSHDIVTPTNHPAIASRVLPMLLEIIDPHLDGRLAR